LRNPHRHLHLIENLLPLCHFNTEKDIEGTESPLFVCVDFMETAAQIKQLADQHLAGTSHFVLEVRVNARMNPPKITVIVDGDNGITIDDCANLSRALSDAIDKENMLENYTLEVTTPGIDQPLKLPRQYTKHVGRNLKVELKDKSVVRGKLLEADAFSIAVEEEATTKKAPKTIQKLTFDQIEKTLVMISFK
jgi:ribosome maturation factor RimP